MGIINRIYNRLALTSPYMELLLRRIYWKNVERLGKLNPNKAKKTNSVDKQNKADFSNIINWLTSKGVGQGDLLIVHSGYGELERTELSPDEIIDQLLKLVGPTGTLAMPVIRRYKEAEKAKKEGIDLTEIQWKYNVKKTMVTSGLLPYTLMHREGAVVSLHPFNPMCAIGPLAKEMMAHNLESDAPSPHGPNSSWNYCLEHGAKVCSIGTDIEHHNTIMHVVEEGMGHWHWPDNIWYNRYRFEIVDENKNVREMVVSNRKDEWGKLHLAELNVCALEKKAGVMYTDTVDGITVGYVNPQKMVELLQSKNYSGYPYFLFPWEKAKNIK